MYGSIYIVTCRVNGKRYVGQTTYPNVERYVNEHAKSASGTSKRPFYRAIRKYGWENFSFVVECTADSKDGLDWLEDEAIRRLGTLLPGGYNARRGGATGSPTIEVRQVLREHALAQGRVAGFNVPGEKRSIERCQNQRLAHLGKALSRHHAEAIAASHRGKKRKPGSGDNIAAGLRRYSERRRQELGLEVLPAWKPAGWKHSPETIEKLTRINRETGLRRRKPRNPRQYFWITDGETSKRHYGAENAIPLGWRIGRLTPWVEGQIAP